MKKMGMEQENIEAQEVIFRLADRDLIITNPEVAKINMMGQETYQVVGQISEHLRDATPDIDEEDIKTVVEATGANYEEAKEAILRTQGDLAQAILELKEDHE